MPNRRRPIVPLTEAQRKLVADNIGLAYSAAHKWSMNNILGFEDRLSACMEAICLASQTYDPAKGSFASHVFWQCRGKIDEAKAHSAVIHIPRAARSDVSRGKTSKFAAAAESAMKCETCVENLDDLAVAPTEDVEIEARDQWRKLENLLRRLPRRDQFIIHQRILKGRTLRRIGDRLHVTYEGVRLLEGHAIAALRVLAVESGLDG